MLKLCSSSSKSGGKEKGAQSRAMLVESHGSHAEKEVFKRQGVSERISCGGKWVAPRKCSERTWKACLITPSACSKAIQFLNPHASSFFSFLISPSFFPFLPVFLPPTLLSISPAPTTSFPFSFPPPFPPRVLPSLSCPLPSSSLCSSHLSSFSSFFS